MWPLAAQLDSAALQLHSLPTEVLVTV